MRQPATGVLVLAFSLVACSEGVGVKQSALTATPWTRLVTQVSIHPGGPGKVAEGPSAVAVSPDGAVLVLDRLGQRVLRVAPSGPVVPVAIVPRDVEDLVAGPQGELAVYSPLRARVWIHDQEGKSVGELAVPRILRMVRAIALDQSRMVWVQDVHQQRFRLGSPAFPQPLPTLLHSQCAGEYKLSNGHGVMARVKDGVASLVVVAQGADRTRTVASHDLGAKRAALAARIVGVAGQTACLRLELQGPRAGLAISVQRKAICVDAGNGQVVLEADLPDPWRHVPRRELAVGGVPPRLAAIHTSPKGVQVRVWPLPIGEGGAR